MPCSRAIFALVLAGVMHAAPVVARQNAPAAPTAARSAQKPPAAPAPPATYVGADTCLACHDDTIHGFNDTLHGKASDPRTPAAAQGCETCHGPGSRHVDDPSDDT